jgi:hypothetical protein
MSAASITNPTNTSNGVAVIIAHLAHVAERHRQTGRMFGVHLTNPQGPVEFRKSVKQQESCEDAEGNDFTRFGRRLGVGGHLGNGSR